MENSNLKNRLAKPWVLLLKCFIFVLIVGCSKDDGPYINTLEPDDSEYLYFISGKTNGEPFNYGLRKDANTVEFGVINGVTGTCNMENENSGAKSFSTGIYPIDSDPQLPSMIFNFARFYECSNIINSLNVFNDLFPVGSYNIDVRRDDYSNAREAVGVMYKPNIGEEKIYSTYDGSQEGSFFEITSSIEGKEFLLGVLISSGQALEGNFEVTLYNEDNPTDVLEITEGSFKIFIRHM